MRRFYKLVSIGTLEDGYGIFLDGKPIRTRSGQFLCVKSEKLANEIANEWSSQVEEIIPESMPLTQIVNTVIDRVANARSTMSISILKYIDTDLICYPANEPEELVNMQENVWKPWRVWFENKFGISLNVTTNLIAVRQDNKVHKCIEEYIAALCDNRFTVLQIIAALSGSLILSLAFLNGVAQVEDILQARFVEENYKDKIFQADFYGQDPMQEKIRKQVELELLAAQKFLVLTSEMYI